MAEEFVRRNRTTVSKDILKQVRRSLGKEIKLKEIAKEVEISISCARSLSDKIVTGLSDDDILGIKKGRHAKPNEILKSEIRSLIDSDPSHTLNTIRNCLREKGINSAPSTIAKYLKSMEMTRKRLTLVPRERNSTKILDLRQEYCRYISNVLDQNLVFLDETGFNLHTRQKYGYSLKNTKCFVTVPANRGSNISLMTAINTRGIVAHEIKEGAYNGTLFIDFISNKLKSHFEAHPHDVLIMDNCAFHHRRDVVELLNDLRISFKFLPAYSPQLNPIEEYFSHLKSKYVSAMPAPANKTEVINQLNNIIADDSIGFGGWFSHMRTWIERGISRHEFH